VERKRVGKKAQNNRTARGRPSRIREGENVGKARKLLTRKKKKPEREKTGRTNVGPEENNRRTCPLEDGHRLGGGCFSRPQSLRRGREESQ